MIELAPILGLIVGATTPPVLPSRPELARRLVRLELSRVTPPEIFRQIPDLRCVALTPVSHSVGETVQCFVQTPCDTEFRRSVYFLHSNSPGQTQLNIEDYLLADCPSMLTVKALASAVPIVDYFDEMDALLESTK